MTQDAPQKRWPASSQPCHKKFSAVPWACPRITLESISGQGQLPHLPWRKEGDRSLQEKSDEKTEQNLCSPGTSLEQGKNLIPHTHSLWRERLA